MSKPDNTASPRPEPRKEAGSATPTPALACSDCGLAYGGPSWADFVIPDGAWAEIGMKAGVLCVNCMVGRAGAAGIQCQGRFTSGPFTDGSATPVQDKPCGTCKALRKLCAEVGGLRAFEDEVRDGIGTTNWNVLQLRFDEANNALQACPTCPGRASSPEGAMDDETFLRALARVSNLSKESCQRCELIADRLTSSPASTGEPIGDSYRTEITHPNNRLLFKRLCHAAGIDLSKDDIASAIAKVAALTPAVSTDGGEVEPVAFRYRTTNRNPDGTSFPWHLVYHDLTDWPGQPWEVEPLYTRPTPPVVDDDAMERAWEKARNNFLLGGEWENEKTEALAKQWFRIGHRAALSSSKPLAELCEDEGCPHFGTPHVCISSKPLAAKAMRERCDAAVYALRKGPEFAEWNRAIWAASVAIRSLATTEEAG